MIRSIAALIAVLGMPLQVGAFSDGQAPSFAIPAMSSAPYLNQGGPRSATTLAAPSGIAIAGTRLIVADSANNRVLIYNNLPTSNGAAADIVLGQPDFASGQANRGGPVAANSMDTPSGVATDGTTLFVADSGNHRVVAYLSIPSSSDTPADYVIGQTTLSASGTGTGLDQLGSPMGLATDGVHLAVADTTNHRVLLWNVSNSAQAYVVIGQTGPGANQVNQGTYVWSNTLSSPTDVAFAGGKLYLGDRGNNRVLIFNSVPVSSNASADLELGQNWFNFGGLNAGSGYFLATPMSLNRPLGLCVDSSRLFIADHDNSRIVVHESLPASNARPGDRFIGQNSGFGTGVLPQPLSMLEPCFMAFGGGKLWVSDSSRSRVMVFNDVVPMPLPTPATGTLVYTPFTDHFESGPALAWSFSGFGSGVALTTQAQAINGTSLAFQSVSPPAQCDAQLCVDLSGWGSYVYLQFTYRRYGGSLAQLPSWFNNSTPVVGNGVQLSADGITWFCIDGFGAAGPVTLNFSPGGLLQSRGFFDLSHVRIRVSYSSQGLLPGDGLVIDDVKLGTFWDLYPYVYSSPPKVANGGPATGSNETLAYPNPVGVGGLLKVSFAAAGTGEAKLSLFTQDGQLLTEISGTVYSGQNHLSLSLSGIPQGVYFYTVGLRDDNGHKVFPMGKILIRP